MRKFILFAIASILGTVFVSACPTGTGPPTVQQTVCDSLVKHGAGTDSGWTMKRLRVKGNDTVDGVLKVGSCIGCASAGVNLDSTGTLKMVRQKSPTLLATEILTAFDNGSGSGPVLQIKKIQNAQDASIQFYDSTGLNWNLRDAPSTGDLTLYNNSSFPELSFIRSNGSVVIGGTAIQPNPYGFPELLTIKGATVISATRNCVGDSCFPTPGRVLTASGWDSSYSEGGATNARYAIGLDIHPKLIANFDSSILVDAWFDPSGPSGESKFNCNGHVPCDSAGIVNIQPLNQLGYIVSQGDFIGAENGHKAAFRNYVNPTPTYIIGVGNFNGKSNATFDIGNSSPADLQGLIVYPTLKNTATGTNTHNSQFAASMGILSTSTHANNLTRQGTLEIQSPVTDGNTTTLNKVGIQVEPVSGGTVSNWSILNKGNALTMGRAFFQGDANWFSTSDYNISTNTGSAIRLAEGDGATTGNTYGVIQQVQNGNSSLGPLVINPFGGDVSFGTIGDSGYSVYVQRNFRVHGGARFDSTLDVALNVITGGSFLGDVPVTDLNGGALASDSTFWRGDGVWRVPAKGIDSTKSSSVAKKVVHDSLTAGTGIWSAATLRVISNITGNGNLFLSGDIHDTGTVFTQGGLNVNSGAATIDGAGLGTFHALNTHLLGADSLYVILPSGSITGIDADSRLVASPLTYSGNDVTADGTIITQLLIANGSHTLGDDTVDALLKVQGHILSFGNDTANRYFSSGIDTAGGFYTDNDISAATITSERADADTMIIANELQLLWPTTGVLTVNGVSGKVLQTPGNANIGDTLFVTHCVGCGDGSIQDNADSLFSDTYFSSLIPNENRIAGFSSNVGGSPLLTTYFFGGNPGDTVASLQSIRNALDVVNFDSSGSGNMVRQSSPALITPNIGAATGTSLNLFGTSIVGGLDSVNGRSHFKGASKFDSTLVVNGISLFGGGSVDAASGAKMQVTGAILSSANLSAVPAAATLSMDYLAAGPYGRISVSDGAGGWNKDLLINPYGGNVGIGGSGASPTHKLEVTGAGYFTGTISASNITFGTFTATLTGVSGTVTQSCSYSLNGNQVTITIPQDITGTSNSTTMTFTGLPAALQPSTPEQVFGYAYTTATTEVPATALFTNSGTVTFAAMTSFGALFSSSAWAATIVTKGIPAQTFTYNLQ